MSREAKADRTARGYVLIVGPDGAGKSAIADELHRLSSRAGLKLHRSHWRPGILFGSSGPAPATTEPHAAPSRGALASSLKVIVVFVDFMLAWIGPWRAARGEGVLVVERGWHDQQVDPTRYRLSPTIVPVVALLGRLLPKARVVAVVHGEPRAIHARKPELQAEEIARQQDLWLELAPHLGERVLPLDSTKSSVAELTSSIVDGMSSTALDWKRALAHPRLGLRFAGTDASAFGVYRPARTTATLGLRASRVAARLSLLPDASKPRLDVSKLASELGLVFDGVVAMNSSTAGRLVIGLASGGVLQHVAKVGGKDDLLLRNEAIRLKDIASGPWPFEVPAVRWSGDWNGAYVLVTDAYPAATRPPRVAPSRAAEIATALCLSSAGMPKLHGDLTSWNLIHVGDRLAVLDWEDASTEWSPLQDLTHFLIQDGALLRRLSPEEVVGHLTGHGGIGHSHLAQVGVDPDSAPVLVRKYLRERPAISGRVQVFHDRVRGLLP